MKLFLPSNCPPARGDNSSHESKEGGVGGGGRRGERKKRETEAEEKFGTCSRGGVLLVQFHGLITIPVQGKSFRNSAVVARC